MKKKEKTIKFIEEPNTLENFKAHEINGRNIQGGCWGAWICWFTCCPALQFNHISEEKEIIA